MLPPMHAQPAPPGFEDLVERFDHVAVAVDDLPAALPLVDLVQGSFRSGGISRRGFCWAQFFLPGAGKVELLQPLDPGDDSHFLVRFLRRRGSGVHHLTFKVADVTAAAKRAADMGYDVVGLDTSRGRWKEAFVHPRSAQGVLVQFAEFADRPVPAHITLPWVMEQLAAARIPT